MIWYNYVVHDYGSYIAMGKLIGLYLQINTQH